MEIKKGYNLFHAKSAATLKKMNGDDSACKEKYVFKWLGRQLNAQIKVN